MSKHYPSYLTLCLLLSILFQCGGLSPEKVTEKLGSVSPLDYYFKNYDLNPEQLEKKEKGYILIYSNYENCTTCIGRIGTLNKTMKLYPEVGFAILLTQPEMKNEFIALLDQWEIEGQLLLDSELLLKKRFSLGNFTYALFFNSQNHLIYVIRLDLEQEKFAQKIQETILEM